MNSKKRFILFVLLSLAMILSFISSGQANEPIKNYKDESSKHHDPEVNRLTDSEVKQRIIQESIASYPGNCPCPYNTTRNGRACGGRSAWSRAGGYSPICYEKEVTQEMVKNWRRMHPKE